MSPRRRRGGPRCGRGCGRPVVFFRSADDGRWRPFDPAPIDRSGPEQRVAYPVENGARWWRPRDLIEDLMTRHGSSRDEAETEANAMDWYVPHVCLSPTDDPPDDQEDQLTTHQPVDASGGRP